MLFILGIERAATTWVSNLMESHPATRVYVEPMSAHIARFKDWPDRFEEITDTKAKAKYFQSEFEIVKQHRKWLLTKWFQNQFVWKIDLWLSNMLVRKKLATEAAQDFSEINFHRKAQPDIYKNGEVELEVIKELRLNFNAHVLSEIDPNVLVIVVIRNMFANIQSVFKHIQQGNLIELRVLLSKHYESISEKTIYKYWRDSYNNLLNKLSQSDTPHLIVNHTELIKSPEQEIRKICEFTGLSNPEPIFNYLKASDKEGTGIHGTNRSHADLLNRNQSAKEEVLPSIQDVFEQSQLHPELQKMLDT